MSRYALQPSNNNYGDGSVTTTGVVYYGNNQQQQPPMPYSSTMGNTSVPVVYNDQQSQPPMQYNSSFSGMPTQQPYIPSHYLVDGTYNSNPSNGGTNTIIQYTYDNNNGAKAHDWNKDPNGGGCCTIL